MTCKLAIALTLFASQASALSCLPTDAAHMYQRVADSEESYYIVHGTLDPNTPIVVPAVNANGEPTNDKSAITRTRISGQSLSAGGFDRPIDLEVEVEVSCISIWCGGAPSGEVIAALRLTDAAPVLEIGPCGGFLLPAEQKHLDVIEDCHNGQACEPQF